MAQPRRPVVAGSLQLFLVCLLAITGSFQQNLTSFSASPRHNISVLNLYAK